nr:hypothetical protein [uncultured Blautia sp.]
MDSSNSTIEFRELSGDHLAVGISNKGFAYSGNLPMFRSDQRV